jgi:RND superfamily putative drug exporter
MFTHLGRCAASHPWKVCAAWVAIIALLAYFAPSWDSKAQDDDVHFLPARCASVRGFQLLEQAFPQDVFASRVIFAVERTEAPLNDADFALVTRLVSELNQLRVDEPALQIGRVYSHRDAFIGRRLISDDGHCTLIQVSLATPFLALQTRETVNRAEARVRPCVASLGTKAPRVLTTGPAGVGRDLIQASAEGLESTTLATVALVVVVLLLVYRAPLLALVPLATIALSVAVALKILAMLALIPGVHLVNISKIFAVVILYGAGTDYCLFLISRYREELEKGVDVATAIERSVGGVGHALAASAGTVIFGLGLMAFAEFAKVRCAGPAIALSLTVALAASLTLTPAVLRLMGRAVFWPWGLSPVRADHDDEPPPGFWDRVSHAVVHRPVLIWSVSALALLPLAVLGFRVIPQYRPTGELNPQADSVQGLAAIQKHFTAGETGPVTVLLTSASDWSASKGRELIDHLSRGFAKLENVAEVRSLTQPLGSAMPEPLPHVSGKSLFGSLLKTVQTNFGGVIERGQNAARDFYVANIAGPNGQRYVTRLDVVFRSDPFDPASQATLDLIQTWLRTELPRDASSIGDVSSECYGVTVNSHDLATITEADRARVNVMVLTAILVILLGLVRRPWLAIYLLVTVLFSYYATLGATTLLSTLWSGRPLGQVDWRVPFFLFTILVAVGEDYNILLVTRILEERKKYGPIEGTRRALSRTGGTITACGVIMAGTFATLMFAGLNTLVQCGFALAFGVLLDTFVVRPILVPAFALAIWQRTEREEETVQLASLPAPEHRAA